MDTAVNQPAAQAQDAQQEKQPIVQGQQHVEQPAAQGLKQINPEERLKELESFLSERDKEISALKLNLDAAEARVDDFARQAEDASGLVSFHEAAIKKAQETIKARDTALAAVLTAYRTAITQAHPDIPEELITGSTLEELQGNLEKAKTLVQKIRAGGTGGVTTIPAGAPARSGPDFNAMSSREKIVQGLRR